jgi:type IV pilus assembly protein PilW
MMIRAYKAGFSLVELMIAMGLGLALLAGLVSVFANSSRAHRELQQASQHLDNGRFAIETVSSDLQQAGFYGQFYDLPAAPPALPDPCEIASAANLYAALAVPAQLYSAPDYSTRADLSATTCATYGLTASNVLRGTDVLVIRRADGSALAPADVPADQEVYIQSTVLTAQIQFGSSGGSIGTTKKADGTATELFKKDGATAAEIRKYRVHIYFIAPCSLPAGGGNVCTGVADDSGRPIPTLKRLELTASGGTTTMRIVPLAEGIENLQVEFGIDDTPATPQPLTGRIGDGAADLYVDAPSPVQMPNVTSATLYFVARNTEPSLGYVDSKSYSLGLAGATAVTNDQYRRHVFNTAVRLTNPSSRRENP